MGHEVFQGLTMLFDKNQIKILKYLHKACLKTYYSAEKGKTIDFDSQKVEEDRLFAELEETLDEADRWIIPLMKQELENDGVDYLDGIIFHYERAIKSLIKD